MHADKQKLVLDQAAACNRLCITSHMCISGCNTARAYAGDALKASFAHNIDAYQSYGAEVYKNAHSEDVNFLLGYSKRLRDGALTKAKVQNNGNVTLLYEAVSAIPCAFCC